MSEWHTRNAVGMLGLICQTSFPQGWEQALAFKLISCDSHIGKPADEEGMGPDW